jgi:hypothetical protein
VRKRAGTGFDTGLSRRNLTTASSNPSKAAKKLGQSVCCHGAAGRV